MMKFWVLALLTFVSVSSFALPTNLNLVCADNKSISLVADLPSDVAFRKDDEWDRFAVTEIIGDMRASNEWSIVLDSNAGKFKLSSIPRTVEFKTSQYGFTAVFSAKVNYELPHMRKPLSEGKVLCILRNQI